MLSVKVWLFLIPITLSIIFLYWVVNLTIETTLFIENSLNDSNNIVEISKTGLLTIKEMFTNWLKFTGSLVVSIISVREIWKINKIKEDTKRNK